MSFLGNKARQTILRKSINVATIPTGVEILTEMGFQMDYKHTLRGYMFCKERMKITVSEIFKVSNFDLIQFQFPFYFISLFLILFLSGIDNRKPNTGDY